MSFSSAACHHPFSSPSVFRRHHHNTPLFRAHKHSFHFTPLRYSFQIGGAGGGGSGGSGGGGGGGGGNGDDSFNQNHHHHRLFPFNFSVTNDDVIITKQKKTLLYLIFASAASFINSSSSSYSAALAKTDVDDELPINDEETVFEIRGGRRVKLAPDHEKDEFVVAEDMWSWLSSGGGRSKSGLLMSGEDLLVKCKELATRLMLPEGFPDSVTDDYLDYSLWRGVQGVAAQVSGVLATQALLYAVGLGKGAIPTAAALNWVLKDGIGYLSKIVLSKYGRHFDVNPKGWRLFADLLENAAFGMEILTPAFPHLFVPIGAAAGAGRSAAALIQAATRSCFYAGFAAQRNFAEVIAKGEAQGMVSKSIGIVLGIGLANCVQSSTPLSLACFGVITWIHMFCNLKSYQSIQLRTLNPYRASLVFSQYLLSGIVPSVKEVNAEEPLFPAFPHSNLKPTSQEQIEVLSSDAKDAASHIDRRLQLGSRLSDIVNNREDAIALLDLYKSEGYILSELEGRYCVVLKESSTSQDMLKSLFQVNYLYWLEKNAGIKPSTMVNDCRNGGRLQLSLEYVQNEFSHFRNDGKASGWVVEGLIARPLPNKVRIGNETTTPSASVS